MSDRQQSFRLGLFVFLMLAGLAAMVFFFGGARKWFSGQREYYALFGEAPGLIPGSPVRKSGVRVGEVSELSLVPDTGKVRVAMRLKPDFTPNAGDQPTITRTLIPGESGIDFVPRNFERPEVGAPIPPGSIIEGVSPLNPRALIDRAGDIIPEIRDSLKKLEELGPQARQTMQDISALARRGNDFIPELQKTNEEARRFLTTTTRLVDDISTTFRADEPKVIAAIQSFEKTSDELRKLLNEDNQKQLNRILTNVGNASEHFEPIARDLESLARDAKQCIDRVVADLREAFKLVPDALRDARDAMADLRRITKPVGDRIEKIMSNLDIGSDQAARMVMDIREILRTFSKAEGTIGRFINDPSFYLNLNETAVGIQRILPRMDRILKDIEVFADKIARHPEALGIGGAVRPDSGLKEAPTVPGPVFKPKP
jgi:phospholipid/cholesterol/gamma-HCH transport system substrate-binding protein